MNQQEKQKVSELIGQFCETRVPPHAQDQIKMLYRINGNNVIIFESRPHWQDESIWTELPIAKMRFAPNEKTWQLFWQRANGRWFKYPDFSPTKNLAELITEIDTDPNHVFWG